MSSQIHARSSSACMPSLLHASSFFPPWNCPALLAYPCLLVSRACLPLASCGLPCLLACLASLACSSRACFPCLLCLLASIACLYCLPPLLDSPACLRCLIPLSTGCPLTRPHTVSSPVAGPHLSTNVVVSPEGWWWLSI
jgi:hypothetical protein